ncbi:MAG: serine hydrolase domain-containing protein [Clostridia bacterium]|nr:serine hydrolase domain-containing protein [Clostridia bacterium]
MARANGPAGLAIRTSNGCRHAREWAAVSLALVVLALFALLTVVRVPDLTVASPPQLDGARRSTVAPMGAWIASRFRSVGAPTARLPVGNSAAPETANLGQIESFLDGFLAEAMQRMNVPGVVFVMVRDGQTVLSRGYGFADLERHVPVDPSKAVFSVGSISKLFTATAVMQLVDRGLVDLDDDVNHYLDSLIIPPTYPAPITIGNLLTHTAGFDEGYIGMASADERYAMPLLQYLAKCMPARIRPSGQEIQYSNYGMALAGYVVEHVSGMPFSQYVKENILAPLAMDHSGFELSDTVADGIAKSYRSVKGSRVQVAVPHVQINQAPAGALMTTGDDIARFMIAHLNEGRLGDARILTPESARAMHTQQFTNHPMLPGVAYGFFPDTRNGRRILSHDGAVWNFYSALVLIPEENTGFFVSCNSDSGAALPYELMGNLFSEFYPPTEDAGSISAIATRPISGFEERVKAIEGAYRPTRYPRRTVEKLIALSQEYRVEANRDGSIVLHPPGGSQPAEVWVEIEPFVFRKLGADTLMAFREASPGDAGRMFIGAHSFEKLRWYEGTSLHVPLIVGCTALFALAIVVWLVRALPGLTRRSRSRMRFQAPGSRLAGRARILCAAVGILNIAALGSGALGLLSMPEWEMVSTAPRALVFIRVLSLVGVLPAIALAVFVVRGSRHRGRLSVGSLDLGGFGWRRARMPFVTAAWSFAVLAAEAGVLWFLYYWNLLRVSF